MGIVFHSVEKVAKRFPCRGKIGGLFSTVWKKSFHSVENGSIRAGLSSTMGHPKLFMGADQVV
jgi:hypothetical protein